VPRPCGLLAYKITREKHGATEIPEAVVFCARSDQRADQGAAVRVGNRELRQVAAAREQTDCDRRDVRQRGDDEGGGGDGWESPSPMRHGVRYKWSIGVRMRPSLCNSPLLLWFSADCSWAVGKLKLEK
jgi:hypothetical protein